MMKKRKILDVVLECIDKGIDSKSVLEELRINNHLIEPKRKQSLFKDEDFDCNSQINEISDVQWEKLEREYLKQRCGDNY
jgi:hypothetical protein